MLLLLLGLTGLAFLYVMLVPPRTAPRRARPKTAALPAQENAWTDYAQALADLGREPAPAWLRDATTSAELTADQKKEKQLASGLVVTDVRPDARADVRKGDILLTLVHKGQQTELKSVEQFNKLLASLDKSAVITLQVKRGESTAFVTIAGLTDKG